MKTWPKRQQLLPCDKYPIAAVAVCQDRAPINIKIATLKTPPERSLLTSGRCLIQAPPPPGTGGRVRATCLLGRLINYRRKSGRSIDNPAWLEGAISVLIIDRNRVRTCVDLFDVFHGAGWCRSCKDRVDDHRPPPLGVFTRIVAGPSSE
jgi:hypothetical protein